MPLMQDLPLDILLEIFIRCLPTAHDKYGYCQPNTKIAPLLLCQICSAWRMAALGFPRLWAELRLGYGMPRIHRVVYKTRPVGVDAEERYVLPSSMEFVDWWTRNAKSVPMSITLQLLKPNSFDCHLNDKGEYVAGHRVPENATNYPSFLSILFRSVVHQALEIELQELRYLCATAMPNTFASLETLSLLQPKNFSVNTSGVFPPTPCLRRLCLKRHGITPTFPWMQLTHLCIECMFVEDVWIEMMKTCRNLLSGAFEIVNDYTMRYHHNSSDLLEHNNLRELVISPRTFDSIRFPALKALRILGRAEFFMIGSFGSLATLLKATPSLNELHLDATIMMSTPPFSNFYNNRDPESACQLAILLPDLETLVFYQVQYGPEDILRLLQSDWMRLSPRNGRKGRVELIFGQNVHDARKAMAGVQKFEEYLATHAGSLGYEVCLRHGQSKPLYPHLWCTDLSRWDEMTGFYGRFS